MELLTLKTILLGLVEGLTEFVPVSSTAHILLTGKIIGISSQKFLEAITIGIQSGAILAVVYYYFKTIWYNRTLWGKIVVAFLPTAGIGVLLYPLIKSFLASTLIIAIALIVGGIALIVVRPNDAEEGVATISYKQAFLIGLMQVASFIPGVSRAGATLIGGTLIGIPRRRIVSFSFILAIPTILGASFVEFRHVSGLTPHEWSLIAVGTVVACITALATIQFFIRILTQKPLSWFGWYRIVIGVLVLIFLV